MKNDNYLIFLALTIIVLLGTGTVSAEVHFAHNSSEIVRGLTAPRPRALTRAFTVPRERTVVVVEYSPAADAAAKVEITEAIDNPKVNLKIEFASNSATINANSYKILNELLIALDDPELADKNTLLCGHTDAVGPDDYNLDLSYQRALAVKTYIQANRTGQQHQIKVRGYGETLPLADNHTDSGRQKNRRVEIRIVE